MKASYLVIVLLLSDVTLTSGDDPNYILLGGSGIVLGVIMFAVFQRLEMLLPFDPKLSRPNSSCSLSTGPQEWEKIIARNIYQKGEHSKHYINFIAGHHFPLKDQVDMYSEQLKKQIGYQISSFPLTMFVFDEMDKMNPQLAEAIKPFLNFVPYVNEVSYHRAIFIFLSNAGGNVIASTAADFLSAGKSREEIQMNSKGMDAQILQSIFSYESSGFWQLVDHFVPFLPLERKHIRQCVLAEMASLKISVHHHPDLADKVVREMPFFPEEEKIFSIKGCKSVRQKLMLYINEMNIIE